MTVPRKKTEGSLLASGVIYIGIVIALIGGLVLQGAGTFEETFPVTTEVATVGGGLAVGADVKLRGLAIGQVTRVDARRGRAKVTMELDPELARQVPASVQARVLTANLFGVPFIELVPKGPETPTLTENAKVAADSSAEARELAMLYETAYDVMIAIEPAKLNSALTAISSALQGNGDQVNALIKDSAAYVSALTPNRARFERNLDLLARVLNRVDPAMPALLDAVDNSAALARIVVENRQQFADLLSVGRRTLDTTDGIIKELEPRLIAVTRVSAPVFATLAAQNDSPLASLLALGRVARRFIEMGEARDGRLTVSAFVTGVPFPTYTAADCPRYGSLSGSNCASGRMTSRAYAGSAGPVGSAEETAALRSVTGASPRASGLVGVVAGPALRGQVVATR